MAGMLTNKVFDILINVKGFALSQIFIFCFFYGWMWQILINRWRLLKIEWWNNLEGETATK